MKSSLKKFIELLLHPVSCGVVVLLLLLCFNNFALFNQLNRLGYDMMLWKRGQRDTPAPVMIVDLDERSLRALGRWPWPRKLMSEFLDRAVEQGAKVVALDMTFSEIDQLPGADKRLGDAVQRSQGKVILGYFMHFPQTGLGRAIENNGGADPELPVRFKTLQPSAINVADISGQNRASRLRLSPVVDLVTPIPEVARGTSHLGYFNSWPDKDNTSRTTLPVYPVRAAKESRHNYFPSLGLAAAAQYLNATPQIIFDDSEPFRLLLIDNRGDKIREIPIDTDARLAFNYYGSLRSFTYVSAVDVIRGVLPRGTLRDKLLLVGSSSAGVFDLVKIPHEIFRGYQTPGVELHATLAANILDGKFLRNSWWIYFMLLLLPPMVLIAVLARSGPVLGLAAAAGLIVAEILFSYWMLVNRGTIIWVATPTLALAFVYVGMTFMQYRAEEVRRRFIKRAFEHYLSPTVIQQIVENPEQLQLKGERRRLTILFSDIRDFTSISEQLTPTALHDLLTAYLTPMTEIIINNNGTLDKYIGDAIMAFYGAPVHMHDHVQRCCVSALEMQRALHQLLRLPGMPPLQIGIGINTGEVSVGNMGSTRLFDYTVLGDAVNLASRLEGVNKLYGTGIIVSESTYLDAKDAFIFRELDRIQVKGKQNVVTVYELVNEPQRATTDDLKLIADFHSGLGYYREQRWQEAIDCFERCLRINPQDSPSLLFIDRCARYRLVAPVAWDGIFRLDAK